MSNHTPGPWTAFNHPSKRWVVFGAKCNKLAELTTHKGTGIEEESDARLMAAAPDLLEALKTMIANPRPADESPENYSERYESYSRAWDAAIAIIAKLEGRI